jgi:NAD(P)-dependent dehydrogenase (short-subunit alcohol dehydrogenase family)
VGRLDNKVAIITGASGYIGSATARLFAAEGARVICADIAADKLDALVEEITAIGGVAESVVTDVTQEDQIARMMDAAVSTFGRLDILMNCATAGTGDGADGNVVSTPNSEWDWALKINLYATIWGCKHAIPRMMETGGGSIINMASMLHRLGGNQLIAIGVAKAAIVALTRYVAVSHGKQGIRANVIAPGFMDTPMGRDASRRRADRALTVPFGRQGTGWEVAYAALFLISNESSYVNAHTLFLDGGHLGGVVRG